jgi:hypothetical protein
MKDIAPTSLQRLVKKAKAAVKNVGPDDDLDLDHLDLELSGLDNYEHEDIDVDAAGGGGGEDEVDIDVADIDVVDTVGKALALVTQVTSRITFTM